MIRIAIAMLLGARLKFIGLITGVLFTSFLITHFQAMLVGIMTRTYAMVDDMPVVDVWVMDPAVEYVDETAGLPATALDRVRSVPGVAWATRFYSGNLRARLPGGRIRSVNVIGLDDASLVGFPGELTPDLLARLRSPDAVVADRASARTLLRPSLAEPGFGNSTLPIDLDAPSRPLAEGDEMMVNDRRVLVVALTDMKPRFQNKGTLFTTYSRAVSLAPPERNLTSFILVKAAEGSDKATLARDITAATGLRALTAREFTRTTVMYYIKNTDIIGQVGMMTIISVVVGISITGLLLFMFTAENLRYYAVLVATGASNRLILAMVAAQCATVGVVGYGLGVGGSSLMGELMVSAGMPYRLLWPSLIITGFFVAVVCVLSGILSARQVARLEPGMVFRA